jgi:hypothetical protein
MLDPSSAQARHTRRLEIWFASIWLLMGAIELIVWRGVEAVSEWQWILFASSGLAFFCLILVSRQRPRGVTVAAFHGNIVVSAVALFVTNGQLAASGVRFQAFLGFKAYLIMGALLLPEDLLIAVPFFVAGAILPAIEWATWPAAWHSALSVGEPLGTVAVGVLAVTLYAHRVRSTALQRRMANTEAQALAMQRIARMSLAVRDLANTPLQTLELGLEVMERGQPVSPEQRERLWRAMARLRDLNRLLEPYAQGVTWLPGDESIDSEQVLSRSTPK